MHRKKHFNEMTLLWIYLVLLTLGLIVLYFSSDMIIIRKLSIVIISGSFIFSIGLYVLFRRTFISYADYVCNQLDILINGKMLTIQQEEDTLTSKIDMRLDKLNEVVQSNISSNKSQKNQIQKMVSDISHQLKTPIANITLYSSMLEDNALEEEEIKRFLYIINGQVEKLEFLINALQKMSRLENDLISLEIQPARILDTLLQALSQVENSAKKKKINISMNCDENIILPHDAKWTTEALFNILDNAVKYTGENGHIDISVNPWEIYTKIDIADNGIGIKEEHFQDIFKRFYREGKVHNVEGVGIGLYLSREIITKQNGYIKVLSKEGEGTVFSVFLPNYF